MRESRGESPIHNPAGIVQIAERPTATNTRPKVASASLTMSSQLFILTWLKSKIIFQAPNPMRPKRQMKAKTEIIGPKLERGVDAATTVAMGLSVGGMASV